MFTKLKNLKLHTYMIPLGIPTFLPMEGVNSQNQKKTKTKLHIQAINMQNSNYRQAANEICKIRIDSFLNIYYIRINANFTQHNVL